MWARRVDSGARERVALPTETLQRPRSGGSQRAAEGRYLSGGDRSQSGEAASLGGRQLAGRRAEQRFVPSLHGNAPLRQPTASRTAVLEVHRDRPSPGDAVPATQYIARGHAVAATAAQLGLRRHRALSLAGSAYDRVRRVRRTGRIILQWVRGWQGGRGVGHRGAGACLMSVSEKERAGRWRALPRGPDGSAVRKTKSCSITAA